MSNAIEIENIEEMRLQEGIDDIDLRTGIRELRVGDHVNLTLLTGGSSFEMLTLRITGIRGSAFHGELVKKPTSNHLSELQMGSTLTFSAAHIHSIPKG